MHTYSSAKNLYTYYSLRHIESSKIILERVFFSILKNYIVIFNDYGVFKKLKVIMYEKAFLIKIYFLTLK